ncbi:hypothetical protein ACFY1C_19330 [Streptomyces sp. NPDC001279]|uniref:hypothetical protein n=1 Tax=Streptomyces sp. NPDC001279 TaxID=3364556 RepID=UPI0036BEEFEA
MDVVRVGPRAVQLQQLAVLVQEHRCGPVLQIRAFLCFLDQYLDEAQGRDVGPFTLRGLPGGDLGGHDDGPVRRTGPSQ